MPGLREFALVLWNSAHAGGALNLAGPPGGKVNIFRNHFPAGKIQNHSTSKNIMKISTSFAFAGCLLTLFCTAAVNAAPRTSSQSGNWNDSATWNGDPVPVAGDAVTISSGQTVTVSDPQACASLTVNSSATCQNDGELIVSGDVSGSGEFIQGATGTLKVGGSSGGLTTLNATASGNTVNYTGNAGAGQKLTTYHNLTFSGNGTFFNSSDLTVSGNFALSGTAKVQQGGNIAIGGDLDIGASSQYDPSCNAMTVTGNTTVSGILKDGCGINASLINSLGGDLTVASGGVWQLTDVTEWSVGGSLVNSGSITVTSGGVTFSGSSKTISGTGFSIPKMVVNGTVQNDTSLTVATSLSGSGTLSQGSGASIVLNGTVTVAAFDASGNPNTVTYGGAAQTVVGGTYHHLVLSGSSTKTVDSSLTINGDMTVSSPVRANINSTVSVAGTTTVNSGATLGGTGTVNGALAVNGTLSPGLTTAGALIGTFSLGNDPSLNGLLLMDINSTNGQTADLISLGTSLSFGGTLTVTNRGPALVEGNSFQLFSATSYSGTFAVTNLPTLGTNLVWTNKLAFDGTIAVLSSESGGGGNTNSPTLNLSVSGYDLTLSWDTTTYPGYLLQVQSSGSGITTGGWVDVTGIDGSPFFMTIDPANQPAFFRLEKP
jgi:hypothetical protein